MSNYDYPTAIAALILDNERPINEAAHDATRATWDAIETGEAPPSSATRLLADALRDLVQAEPSIRRALAGGTYCDDFLSTALDSVDWPTLARDWIAEETLQRETVTP